MFYDENGKHVRTKKEILDEAGQLRKGCKIIPKGEVYERTLFNIKDSRFKNDRFLDEVKRSYTDLINIYVKDDKQMFIFGASIKQKNELGMVMGFGCGMIILLNILLNLLGALGIIPPASSFLPFLSIGRSNILLCYALVGIIMSIYRYKDVYPKKIRASQVSFQKTINI